MKRSIQSISELRAFAEDFLKDPKYRGQAIGLSGELGAGKTEFVRQIIALISAPQKVISPTFVIHQSYPGLDPIIEHFDLYRMERLTRTGLIDIGYYDALDRVREKNGFMFVEWPGKTVDLRDLALGDWISFFLESEVRWVVSDER